MGSSRQLSRPASRRRFRAAAVLAVALCVAVVTAADQGRPAGASLPAQARAPRLVLVSQTTGVVPNGEFTAEVGLGDIPQDAVLIVSVHDRVRSRIGYTRTLDGAELGVAIDSTGRVPVTDLALTAEGRFRYSFRLNDGSRPLAEGEIRVDRDGVYPVLFELQGPNGAVLDRLVTHLILLPDQSAFDNNLLEPLLVAPVLELSAPIAHEPGGDVELPPDSVSRIIATVDAVASHPDLRLTLEPSPETIEAMSASPIASVRAAISSLREATDRLEVLADHYVEVDPVALTDAGLRDEEQALWDRGAETIAAILGVDPRPRSFVGDDGTTDDALALRRDRGLREVVLPESVVTPREPSPLLTPLVPFELDLDDGSMAAHTIDADLHAHVDDVGSTTGDPVLAAQNLLADLAVLFFDAPALERGAPLVLDTGLDPIVVDTVLDGISSLGILESVPLSALFGLETDSENGLTIQRALQPRQRAAFDGSLEDYRLTLDRLAGYESMVEGGPGVALVGDVRESMVPSLSRTLEAEAKREYWSTARQRVDEEINAIDPPPSQSFTLTSLSDELPLRLLNRGEFPVTVRVDLLSERLAGGGESALLELPAGRVVDHGFDVTVQGSGTFSVRVLIYSADGTMPLTESTITISSVALSNMGLILSAGALAFLVLWWATHWRRSRKAAATANG